MTAVSIHTADGVFTAFFSDRGLTRLAFPRRCACPSRPALSATHGAATRDPRLVLTAQALRQALAGTSPKVMPPLHPLAGTAFQQKVWKALLAIPLGETRTYAQIAAAIGHPGAARAVGQACGANPIPVLIPCHRVLASQGGLGGFSAGLDWKKRLLSREKALPTASRSP
jgi:O-6-methylguanine DNA methyltransferase